MRIVTHDGKAHLDDLLATALLVYKTKLSVERKSTPSNEELNNPDIFVVDFGKRYEPESKNFDHHQISGGCVCAFTLVLEYFGMRNYESLPWIKFVETYDHNGPIEAMKLVGGGDFELVYCPVADMLIDGFSVIEKLEKGSVFWHMLDMLGEKICKLHDDYLRDYAILTMLAQKRNEFGLNIVDYRLVETESALAQKSFEKNNAIDIILNVNKRGSAKYRMIRKNEKVNFNVAKDVEGVSFIHQSGFLITFSCEPEQILKLFKNES